MSNDTGKVDEQGKVNEETKVSEVTQEAQPVPMDKDDDKRTGVKDAAQNSEAIAIEQQRAKDAGTPVAEKVIRPSFFVDKKKKHRIEVDILANKTNGDIVSVARTDLGLDYSKFDALVYSTEWFEFTMPDYDAMTGYRQKCGVYRREAQQVLVDKLQMRNFLIVWHLKDWSMRDEEGNKVELKFDEDGSLTEASIARVYSLQITILDVVLTMLEKDMLLT